jgi:hypothetical protein
LCQALAGGFWRAALYNQDNPFAASRLNASQFALEKIKTNSAVNPLLWLAALVLPSSLMGAYFLPEFRLMFASAMLTVIVAPIIAYFIWMFRDPNRLQSEDYQLAQQRLLLGDDRNPGVVKAVQGQMVTNDWAGRS